MQLELDFDNPFGEEEPVMQDTELAELIKRRRRQLIVHSYIYYRLNQNLVPDHTYDGWARELIELQEKYPELSSKVEYHKEFKGFQMGDSFKLPMDESWVHGLAHRLLNYKGGTQ